MTNIQLKMLDKLLQIELTRQEEAVLHKFSMMQRELTPVEDVELLTMFDKYLGYGRE